MWFDGDSKVYHWKTMGILWEYNEIKLWYLSNEISKPKYLILHWDLMMIYMGIWCWFDSDFNSSSMYFMGRYLMANPKYNFLEVWTKNRSFGKNDLKHPKFVKKRSAKNIQIPTHSPFHRARASDVTRRSWLHGRRSCREWTPGNRRPGRGSTSWCDGTQMKTSNIAGWIWLVVDLPLWKMMEWKLVGMMTFPTEWKVIIQPCSKPPTRLG